jgi:hypothetical protein
MAGKFGPALMKPFERALTWLDFRKLYHVFIIDLLNEQCHRMRIFSAHNKTCSEIVGKALGTIRRHLYEWTVNTSITLQHGE